MLHIGSFIKHSFFNCSMIKKQIMATIILSAVLVTSGALISNAYANGFEKHTVGDCGDIQIKQQQTTDCTFHLTYTAGVPAIILDSVPAEWIVTGSFDANDNCEISDKKGSKNRGATTIVCDASTLDVDLTVHISTVETPNGKWFKPTFCGELPLNDGAIAVDIDDPTIVLDTTEPLTATTEDQTDEDGDGVVECLEGEIVDLCPEEGLEVFGAVDSDGCPVDT